MKFLERTKDKLVVEYTAEEWPWELEFRCPICDTLTIKYFRRMSDYRVGETLCCCRGCYAELKKEEEKKTLEEKRRKANTKIKRLQKGIYKPRAIVEWVGRMMTIKRVLV